MKPVARIAASCHTARPLRYACRLRARIAACGADGADDRRNADDRGANKLGALRFQPDRSNRLESERRAFHAGARGRRTPAPRNGGIQNNSVIRDAGPGLPASARRAASRAATAAMTRFTRSAA